MPKITATTDARPEGFDDRLMSYYGSLRKRAGRLGNPPQEREDILNDTIVYILSHWRSFRPDGGFYNWISLCMRHVAQEIRRTAARKAVYMRQVQDPRAFDNLQTPASQLDNVELSDAIAYLKGHRHGGVLLRRAMGDSLKEVAADGRGNVEWARQREERARRDLIAQVAA